MDEIKLKNPRSCNHCLAWNEDRCRLGYKTEPIIPVAWDKPHGEWDTWVISIKPAEPCPKPLSNKVLVNVYEKYGLSWTDLMMRNG